MARRPVRFHEQTTALASGRRLAWTRPNREGPHAAVLLLPPLGATGVVMPLADGARCGGVRALTRAFAEADLVTLRLDAEGIDGGATACLEAEVVDARAALGLLAQDPHVDRDGVFVFGWSLGAALAPLAVRGHDVRGVIVFGATSQRWADCLCDGARRQLGLAGLAGPTLEREAIAAARLYQHLFRGSGTAGELLESDRTLAGSIAARDLRGECIHGRPIAYFRALDRIDPAACWRAVDAAVLAVAGEHEWVVGADDHRRIASWAREAGCDALSTTLSGVDHDSVRRSSVAESFANRGRGSFDSAVASHSIEWIRARYTPPREVT